MKDACDTRFNNARDLLDAERFSEAIEAFSDFIALCPESEGAYGNRGLAYMSLGEDELALADFHTVVELNPEDAMGHAMAGEALRYMGRYEDALEEAIEAMELDEQEPTAHYTRGWLFAKAEQYECAAEDIEVFATNVDDPAEASDLLEICRQLASADTVDDDGLPLTDEQREAYLSANALSFNRAYRDNYEAEGLICGYAHCIRTMPKRGIHTAKACPIMGYECPGGEEQAAGCRMHPPIDI